MLHQGRIVVASGNDGIVQCRQQVFLKNTCIPETILYAFSFIVPNVFLSDSSESRSGSLKNCVHRGLGQGLNKQKSVRSAESGMDGFSAFVIQMHCLPVLYQIGLINTNAKIVQFHRSEPHGILLPEPLQ